MKIEQLKQYSVLFPIFSAVIIAGCLILSDSIFSAIEYVATLAFAFNSAVQSYRYADTARHRLLFIVQVTLCCTFGGGFVFRDILILHRTPTFFENFVGMSIAEVGMIFGMLYCAVDEDNRLHHVKELFNLLDFLGLIAFLLGGFYTAKKYFKSLSVSILCSYATATGGGLIASLILFRCDDCKVKNSFIYISKAFFCSALIRINCNMSNKYFRYIVVVYEYGIAALLLYLFKLSRLYVKALSYALGKSLKLHTNSKCGNFHMERISICLQLGVKRIKNYRADDKNHAIKLKKFSRKKFFYFRRAAKAKLTA